MGPRSFSRAFGKTFGTKVVRHIRLRSIRHAQRLMMLSNERISQILLAYRFADQSHCTLGWSKAFVDDSNLKADICALCRALCESDGGRRFIVTASGRSYNLVAPVSFEGLRTWGSIGRRDRAHTQVVTCLSARTSPQGTNALLYRRNPMSEHDAEYFRRRRRAQGIPEREPFSAAKYIKRGSELKGLEQLPWPRDLFGNYASIAALIAEAAELSGPSECRDDVCPCGCRREHRNNVSQTIRSPHGHSFNVVYFCSSACKNKCNREGMGGGTVGSHPGKQKSQPCNPQGNHGRTTRI